MIAVQGPLVLLLRVLNLTPRQTWELDHLRPYPISKVPSLRPGCQRVRPRTLGSSYPTTTKDQQQLQASLRSLLIGVRVPSVLPQSPQIETPQELGFFPLLT